MDSNSADTARLLEQARAGDQAALNEIFAQHRTRLRRMVELRLDRRLQGRIDASDVIQEDIRELFPATVEIEQVKEDHDEPTEPKAAAAAPALQQLGDFRIIREVGKGGMGIVYEAEQVSLGRHVALKVLPRSMLVDARAKRRFEREAKSAAKLHDTNIVPVFGVGEQDGMPYYVDEKDRNRLIKQVTYEEPARLGKLNRQVPQDFETIVHKAIDKDAKERYASAGELSEDLQRFIEDEPIKARRVSATERLRRWCRRNPVVGGLTAALALAFLAGFAGVAWKWREAERQKDIAQAAENREATERQQAVNNLYHSLVREAQAIRRLRDTANGMQGSQRCSMIPRPVRPTRSGSAPRRTPHDGWFSVESSMNLIGMASVCSRTSL